MTGRVLILAGTAEARELAGVLHADGIDVVSSLAGRVTTPRTPAGTVRVGGFGGPDGLAAWLAEHGIGAVVDATHPFAARISASASAACRATGVPLVRLERPGWTAQAGDRWRWVADVTQAAAAVTAGQRVLLALGRQQLAPFATRPDAWFLIRSVDEPQPPLPPDHEIVRDRGPFTLDGERGLLDEHRIDVVVTRDSGGTATRAKLDAARERGLPAIVVQRPPRPATPAVGTVAEAAAWVRASPATGS